MCNTDKWCSPRKQGLASIEKKRCCTDSLMLLFWIASLVACIFLLTESTKAGGDPYKVIRGVDMQGRICGRDEGVKDRPYAVWPNVLAYDVHQCVKSCDESNNPNSPVMALTYPSFKLGHFCLPDAEKTIEEIKQKNSDSEIGDLIQDAQSKTSRVMTDVYTASDMIAGSTLMTFFIAFVVMQFLRVTAGCLVWFIVVMGFVVGMVTGGVLYHYGTQDPKLAAEGAFGQDDMAYYLEIGAYVIWGLMAIYLLVMFSLRTQIKIAVEVTKQAGAAVVDMPFLTLFPALPALIAIGYFFFWTGITAHVFSVTTFKAHNSSNLVLYHYDTDQITDALSGKCQELALPNNTVEKDRLACAEIGSNETACKNLTTCKFAPSEFDFGVTDVLNSLTGDSTFDDAKEKLMKTFRNENPEVYQEEHRADEWQAALWYLLFHFLWQMQAVIYWGYLIVCGAAADWYFTAMDANGHKKRGNEPGELSSFPIFAAIGRSTMWHLGTVQVAALIIAIVQFTRCVIIYIEAHSQGENRIQKCMMCTISCCLRCVECCLDKINRNGLCWTAVYGDNFIVGSCSAFGLLFRNLARVAAINIVSVIIIRVGKFVTVITVTLLCAWVLHSYDPWREDLYSIFFPVIIVLLFSHCIATLCFNVFEAVLDTQFLCFLIDSEVNGDGCMMAPEALRECVDKYASESADKGKKTSDIRAKRRERLGMPPAEGFTNLEMQPGAA